MRPQIPYQEGVRYPPIKTKEILQFRNPLLTSESYRHRYSIPQSKLQNILSDIPPSIPLRLFINFCTSKLNGYVTGSTLYPVIGSGEGKSRPNCCTVNFTWDHVSTISPHRTNEGTG